MNISNKKNIFPKISKKIKSFLSDESGKITKKNAFGIGVIGALGSLETSQSWWGGPIIINNGGHLNYSSIHGHANAVPSTGCYGVANYGVGYNGHYSNIVGPAFYGWPAGHGSHGSHGSHINDPTTPHYNSGCGDSSCFLLNSKVLYYDGIYRILRDVRVGDILMGADGNPSPVIQSQQVILGEYRSMFYFPDKSLWFSGEHPFWIRQKNGEQYWGVNDMNQYLRERNGGLKVNGEIFGILSKDAYPLLGGEEYAHLYKNWISQTPKLDRSFGSDTQLMAIACGGSHTMIVDDYVVSAYADDRDYDYVQFKWDSLGIQKKVTSNH